MKTHCDALRATLLLVLTVFFTVCVNAQSFQWVKKAGGSFSDVGMAVTVDNSNNVYIAGFFGLTAGFDNDSITAVGSHDVFVAKYNEAGTVQWVRQAGGGGEDIASDIIADANGNIYVTGYFTGAAIFGDDTLIGNGYKDIFIAKYTSSGICEWATSAGGISDDEGNSLCVDAAGNVYLSGYFYENASFGSIILSSFGASDIFVAKCNESGEWQWAQKAGGSEWDNGMGISADDVGNLYLTGYLAGYVGTSTHFGAYDINYTGSRDVFTAKCDMNGNFLWAVKAGGPGDDLGNDIATDALGNSFVTGYFAGSLTIGTQTLTSDGPDDYFIAKYDASGNLDWLRQAGGTGYFKGNAISINKDNQVFLTGTFDGTAIFGDTILTSTGYDNIFILKYDNSGNFYWAHQAKGSYYHIVQDINSEKGDAFITGNVNVQAWFDCFQIPSTVSSDIFVAKLNDFINTSKSISGSPVCAGENINVPFTADYDFNPANVFTAQLSDLTGCFDNAVCIGTLTGTTGGTINALIPQNTATGTTYRIRVVSSNPYNIGSDNGSNLTINPAVIAEAGTDTTITPGESMTLGSTPVAGYTYSWSPITGLSDPAIANPVASPEVSTTYYLTVTDNVSGCSDWDSVRVNVISTRLIDADCEATNVDFYQTLIAIPIIGADHYQFKVLNTNIGFDHNIVKNSNEFSLSDLNVELKFNTSYDIYVRYVIGTDTFPYGENCSIKTYYPDSIPQQIIFDRFGNTFTTEQITKTTNVQNIIITANNFELTFVDPNNVYTPDVVDVITQVFNDLSALILPQDCGGTIPQVNYLFEPANTAGVPFPMTLLGAYPGATNSSAFYSPNLQACCNTPPFSENSGVLESEVWRAINTGINDPNFYDAYIVLNLDGIGNGWIFNTDLNPGTTQGAGPGQEIDLYTVVLHEVIHTLGFASLINDQGESIYSPYANMFSRYDLHLYSNTDGSFLLDENAPYNVNFIVAPVTVFSDCNNLRFHGDYSIDIPISNFAAGRLSHFDDNCLLNPPTPVMSPGLSYGEEKRTPTADDINVLMDIGYESSGIFGDGIYPYHSTTLPTGGLGIIGRPDGITNVGCTQAYQFELCPGNDPITISNFLDNDINTVSYTGLEVLEGSISNLVTAGNQFTFTANAPGLITFRYIPVDASGNWGNYTCIYVNVTPCMTNCVSPDVCNFICNPSMLCPSGLCGMNTACDNWMPSHGSPDWDYNPSVIPPDPHYLRMGTHGYDYEPTGWSEGVLGSLNSNIISGETYMFSYWRRRAGEYTSENELQHIYVKLINAAAAAPFGVPSPTPGTDYIVPVLPILPGISQIIVEEAHVTDITWEQVVVCFTANADYDMVWIYPQSEGQLNLFGILYIDRIQLVRLDPDFAGDDFTVACNNPITIGQTNCSVDNLQYQWSQGGVNIGAPIVTPIGVTQINCQINEPVIATTTYQLNTIFPALPTGTVVFPVQNNCLAADDLTVTNTGGITLNTSATDDYCNMCQGTAVVIAANGTLPYSYQWDAAGNQTGQAVTNLCAGAYYVTVTDDIGCSTIGNVVVNATPVLIVDAGNSQTISLGNSASIGGAPTASGGTAPFTYNWSPAAGLSSTSIANPVASPSATTYYIVTVTDANSCTASDEVNIVLQCYADAGPDVSICSGSSTTLTATDGTGASYLWSNGDPTAITTVTPGSTTTYTVNVTLGGCTASDDVTVTVIQFPESNFSVPNLCQASVTFVDESGNDQTQTSYEWNFGDGTIIFGIGDIVIPGSSTTSNTYAEPIHVYSTPGYFSVTLTVSVGTCSAVSVQTISVIPSNAGYNINCCSETQTYNEEESYTIPIQYWGTTWQYETFTTHNPWAITSGNSVLIKKDLIIPTGCELTIQGMTFEFGPNAKVIVDRGAKLNLVGTVFTGLSTCNTMWQGVEVWGVATVAHYLWNGADDVAGQSQQGRLGMIASATIQRAHNGVILGRTTECISTPWSDCKMPYDLNYSGGIINTREAVFNENGVAIKFLPFLPCTGMCKGKVNNDASIISGCNITGGVLLDPGYTIGNIYGYEYPSTNTHCLQYPKANTLGHAVTGIHQWGVRYVRINGDKFHNDLIEGIKSFDSPYIEHHSLFENLDYGIRIFNTSSAVLGHTISDNKYNNNQGFKNISIYNIQMEGSKFDLVKNNSFNTPGSPDLTSIAGILLNNSSNFNINDNEFYKINLGINCFNSGSGGGNIASLTQPDGNVFNECPIDIKTFGSNPGLQIHCNTSNNLLSIIPSTSNWENWGIFNHQGVFDNSSDARGPAGNAFYPPLINSKKVINNHYPYALYTYYRHGGNNYPERIPSPASLNWKINKLSSKYNPLASCIPCKTLYCNKKALADDSIKIVALKDEYLSVSENIDAGQTMELLAAIKSTMAEGNLKNKLLNASPLSDTVLLAMINRTNQLSPGNFKNVILPNSPVSDRVFYDLDIKTALLPPGIAKEITDAQSATKPYRTLTAISRELSETQNDYQLNLNNYVMRLMENDSLDNAISILDRSADNETKQMLFGAYLSDSNIVEAQSRLINYTPTTDEETDWKTLNTLLFAYAQAGKTVYEMNSGEETYIRSLAYNNSGSPATVQAQAVLRLVYGEEFDLPPLNLSNLKTIEEAVNVIDDALDFLSNNIPNPFNNSTLIPYKLPENCMVAKLIIEDISGRLLKTYNLNAEENKITISLDNVESGIYLYQLFVDGLAVQTKKMVIVK